MAERLGPIIDVVEIARPIEHVWRILTDEKSVPHWLGCMRYKCEVGHVFYMQQDRAKAARPTTSMARRIARVWRSMRPPC